MKNIAVINMCIGEYKVLPLGPLIITKIFEKNDINVGTFDEKDSVSMVEIQNVCIENKDNLEDVLNIIQETLDSIIIETIIDVKPKEEIKEEIKE